MSKLGAPSSEAGAPHLAVLGDGGQPVASVGQLQDVQHGHRLGHFGVEEGPEEGGRQRGRGGGDEHGVRGAARDMSEVTGQMQPRREERAPPSRPTRPLSYLVRSPSSVRSWSIISARTAGTAMSGARRAWRERPGSAHRRSERDGGVRGVQALSPPPVGFPPHSPSLPPSLRSSPRLSPHRRSTGPSASLEADRRLASPLDTDGHASVRVQGGDNQCASTFSSLLPPNPAPPRAFYRAELRSLHVPPILSAPWM